MASVLTYAAARDLLNDVLPVFDAYLEKEHQRTLHTKPLYRFAPVCRSYISQIQKLKRSTHRIGDDGKAPESLLKVLRYLESLVSSSKIKCLSGTIPLSSRSQYPKLEQLRVEIYKLDRLTSRQRVYQLIKYVRITEKHDLHPEGSGISSFKTFLGDLEKRSDTPVLDAPILPHRARQGRFLSPEYRPFADALYEALMQNVRCRGRCSEGSAIIDDVHSLNLCLYCAKMYGYDGEDIDLELTITNHKKEWIACRFTSAQKVSDCRGLVRELCKTFDAMSPGSDALAFMTDGNKFYHDGSGECRTLDYVTNVPCSLHEHLDHGDWELLLETKRKLMVIIARAFAQLFGSKWMKDWRRQDIMIFPTKDGEKPNIVLPFLSVAGTKSQTESCNVPLGPFGHLLHGGNVLLRQLGILLIEIERGCSITKSNVHTIPAGIFNDQAATDFIQAHLVYEDMKKELYGPLRSVIELCLYSIQCPEKLKNPSDCDLDIIRKLIDTHIVEPLEMDLKNIIYPRAFSTALTEVLKKDANQFRLKSVQKIIGSTGVPSKEVLYNQAAPMPPVLELPIRVSTSPKSLFFDQNSYDKGKTNHNGVDTWLDDFRKSVTERGLTKLAKRVSRLRIAVIDTRIDRDKPNMRRLGPRLKEVQRFYAVTSESHEEVARNHGSHVVALLHRIAPFADIYVAEVADSDEDSLEDQVLRDALNYAVNRPAPDGWCADIVVMSFGWEAYSANTRYPLFHKALEDVKTPMSSRLFFAAASNGGANRRRTYPAKSSRIFAMHATNFNGDAPSVNFNPTRLAGLTNYSTLGHEVPGHSDSVRVSGTSFAAPVAAGIAASLIEFYRQHSEESQWWQFLRTYDGMKKVFDSMSIRRGDYDYLDWADYFNPHHGDEEVYKRISDALRSM